MPRHLPGLCVHKATQRYYVKIAGVRHYLGKVGGPEEESRAENERVRLLAEHQSGIRIARQQGRTTIINLLAAFWSEAESYYRHKDGTPTSELNNIRIATRPLHLLYGQTLADDFTPQCLEALRLSMVSGSWMNQQELKRLELNKRKPGRSRKVINKDVDRIRRIFRFGVRKGLVKPETWQALLAVEHLKQNRSTARETDEVEPAPQDAVEKVIKKVTRHIGVMLRLQLLTGMRPGEVSALKSCQIDKTGETLRQLIGEQVQLGGCWAYLPPMHKTGHHGHNRIVPIGPKAQAILAPFLLGRDDDAFVFSPRESRDEFDRIRSDNRQTPLTPSSKKRTRKRKPKRKPGERYTASAYAKAIAVACRRLKVTHWHPHQLRHNACAFLVAQFGWEVARIVLGHRTLSSTRIYAPDQLSKAFRAIEEVG